MEFYLDSVGRASPGQVLEGVVDVPRGVYNCILFLGHKGEIEVFQQNFGFLFSEEGALSLPDSHIFEEKPEKVELFGVLLRQRVEEQGVLGREELVMVLVCIGLEKFYFHFETYCIFKEI